MENPCDSWLQSSAVTNVYNNVDEYLLDFSITNNCSLCSLLRSICALLMSYGRDQLMHWRICACRRELNCVFLPIVTKILADPINDFRCFEVASTISCSLNQVFYRSLGHANLGGQASRLDKENLTCKSTVLIPAFFTSRRSDRVSPLLNRQNRRHSSPPNEHVPEGKPNYRTIFSSWIGWWFSRLSNCDRRASNDDGWRTWSRLVSCNMAVIDVIYAL